MIKKNVLTKMEVLLVVLVTILFKSFMKFTVSYKCKNQVLEVNLPSFEVTTFPLVVEYQYKYNLVPVNTGLLAIGDTKFDESFQKCFMNVEIFSQSSKTWRHHDVQFDNRTSYCACFFMRKLYVIGGYLVKNGNLLGSCLANNLV